MKPWPALSLLLCLGLGLGLSPVQADDNELFLPQLAEKPAEPLNRSDIDAAYDADDYETAVLGYEQWVKEHRDDQEVWFRLGNLYTQILRPMDALLAFRKAQILKPEDPRPWNNMGMLYLRLAIESYDNLRRNVPAQDPLVPYAERVMSGILDLVSIRMQDKPIAPLKPLVPEQPAPKP
jgi:tetratricopeptide (TPR) repeat protein